MNLLQFHYYQYQFDFLIYRLDDLEVHSCYLNMHLKCISNYNYIVKVALTSNQLLLLYNFLISNPFYKLITILLLKK